MRVVCRRTGLSAELLRVWERRHQVVKPSRTQTGRRLYSDAEIERLALLYRATLGGRTIGHVAGLSNPALALLVRQDAEAEAAQGEPGQRPVSPAADATAVVGEALRALERFDAGALELVLRRAARSLPVVTFLETIVARLLSEVGTRWRDGSWPSAPGHLAAASVRRVVESLHVAAPAGAPRLLVATLKGQRHDLGALMAGIAAEAAGWSATILGADVPADDIADAARRLRARAVALSMVHPAGDVTVSTELRRLRALLPRPVRLLVGGSAAPSYALVLAELGAEVAADLGGFERATGRRRTLHRLARNPPRVALAPGRSNRRVP